MVTVLLVLFSRNKTSGALLGVRPKDNTNSIIYHCGSNS